MTKRDVAVWFCKVLACAGMIQVVFGLIQSGVFASWGITGANGGPWFIQPSLSLALNLFFWLFADSIGTELAAEGEQSSPVTSRQDLGQLLFRCAGLYLFVSGTLAMMPILLFYAYELILGKYAFEGGLGTPPRPNRATPTRALDVIWIWIILSKDFLLSIVGFLLAFTPRIRAAFRN